MPRERFLGSIDPMVRNSQDPYQALFDFLEEAVSSAAFPGCVAHVTLGDTLLYHCAHGVLATDPRVVGWGIPVQRTTVYDVASLTKVLATTTLVALAVGEGCLTLDASIPTPWSGVCPGASLGDLLEHCAGCPAHREYFSEVTPFSAAEVSALVASTAPVCGPRIAAIYSDIGFMILGWWLERVFDAPLQDLFADRVAYPLGLRIGARASAEFLPISSRLPREYVAHVAPTEVYDAALHDAQAPSYLHVRRREALVAHAEVHDDNAWVMGGVAGHAGLFGTADAVAEIAAAWTKATLPGLSQHIRDRFWQKSRVPGSTRCLGFDTANPDGSGSTAGVLSPRAVGHTGFTGTSLWIDPGSPGGIRTMVLLSNRVHPTRDNPRIQDVRRRFHELALLL